MVDGVPDDFGFGDTGVGDELAIWAPGGCAVGAGIVGDSQQRCPGVWVVGGDDPDVAVVVGVGFFAAVADEGDQSAVWAPRGVRIVVVAGGDLRRFRLPAGINILHVEMGAAAVEVAGVVALELQAVDDPGAVFVPGVFLFRLCGLFRVADDENEPAAVGRPGVVIDALFDMAELPRLSPAPVEGPDLGFPLVARGEE